MKKKFFLIIIFAVFLAVTTNANADQVNNVLLYSEFRHYSAPFTWDDGYLMQGFAYVDVNTYPVYLHKVPNSLVDESLDYWSGWGGHPPYLFSKDFITKDGYPLPGFEWENRTYTFYIDSNQNGELNDGEPKKTLDILSNSIAQIGVPSTVTISGGIHPTITWNKVADADWYRVRLFPIVDGNPNRVDLLDGSGKITDDDSLSYSYKYTGDAFDTYGTLAVAVETYDDAGLTSWWVNRSVHYSQYNPVPETASMPAIPLLLLDD